MLRTRGGLEATQYVDVEEMVAILLHIVAHDVKNKNCLGALDGTHIKVNVSATWAGYYYLCDAGYLNAEGFFAP
uniref:Nuclease HARBI1 n=1 Tax=Cucumis melo TaxID=3656 RepID=A0A9I9E525_CUCME